MLVSKRIDFGWAARPDIDGVRSRKYAKGKFDARVEGTCSGPVQGGGQEAPPSAKIRQAHGIAEYLGLRERAEAFKFTNEADEVVAPSYPRPGPETLKISVNYKLDSR